MKVISIYANETHSKNGTDLDIDIIFANILRGKWKKEVEEIRFAKHNFKLEEERCHKDLIDAKTDLKYQKAKEKLRSLKSAIPRFTISGKFSDISREKESLVSHSGFIDIDIDRLESQTELLILKERLIADDYCQACFISCGGDGLSCVFRIDPTKHEDTFSTIKEYFYNTYRKSIDIVHCAVNGTRNVSYDPDLFYRDTLAKIFKAKKKKEAKKETKNFVYAKNDFEEIIREIILRKIDFCPDYESYRDIGFAIGSKFGESGLSYFDQVCQYSDRYNQNTLERDYLRYFCKDKTGGKTIASFYARCKEFNIDVVSEKTKKIASVASSSRAGGGKKEDVIKNLQKFEGISEEDSSEIVNQVFDNKIEFSNESSLLDDIELYIKHNYSLKMNSITGKLENNGVEWNKIDLNGMYIQVKKAIDKADAKWMERVIFSPFIKQYNPIRDFFNENLDKMPDELLEKNEIPAIIKRLWKSIKVDNYHFLEKFGTKWLVSIVASAFGEPSNLELSFVGKMDQGKSFFFVNLLPKELMKYYAKSSLDSNNANDDYTLLCQKLLILQDESSGKTRADEKKHRRILDQEQFDIRRPYREDLETMLRLGVLCSTSNPTNILQGDNRRIIPVNVLSRNFKEYDAIDKTELFMAAYYLWKNGFVWRVGGSEVTELMASTNWSQTYSEEYELLTKYFQSTETGGELLSAADIKMRIETETRSKISHSKLTNELRVREFKSELIHENGMKKTLYRVKFLGQAQISVPGKVVDYF